MAWARPCPGSTVCQAAERPDGSRVRRTVPSMESIPESNRVVDRADIKAPLREQLTHLKSIRWAAPKTALTLASITVAAGAAVALVVSNLDSVARLAVARVAGQASSSLELLAVLVVSALAARFALKVPPPGGAGALVGDSDTGTWQTSVPWLRVSVTGGLFVVFLAVMWVV